MAKQRRSSDLVNKWFQSEPDSSRIETKCALEPMRQARRFARMTEEALGRYYAGREKSERAESREAYDWRAAAAHAELADRYEALATVFGAKRVTKVPIDYL